MLSTFVFFYAPPQKKKIDITTITLLSESVGMGELRPGVFYFPIFLNCGHSYNYPVKIHNKYEDKNAIIIDNPIVELNV